MSESNCETSIKELALDWLTHAKEKEGHENALRLHTTEMAAIERRITREYSLMGQCFFMGTGTQNTGVLVYQDDEGNTYLSIQEINAVKTK